MTFLLFFLELLLPLPLPHPSLHHWVSEENFLFVQMEVIMPCGSFNSKLSLHQSIHVGTDERGKRMQVRRLKTICIGRAGG